MVSLYGRTYVHVHECTQVGMHVCTHTYYRQVHVHTCAHVHTYSRREHHTFISSMYVRTQVSADVHVCIYVCMYICICTCTYVRMSGEFHTTLSQYKMCNTKQIRKYVHTYVHTYWIYFKFCGVNLLRILTFSDFCVLICANGHVLPLHKNLI